MTNDAEITRLRMLVQSAEHLQGLANNRISELQRRRKVELLAGSPAHALRKLDDQVDFQRYLHSVEGNRILLVRERLRELTTDFPNDGAELKAKLDELVAREADLKARQKAVYPGALSAAEDDELRVLEQRIFEMRKRVRQLDRAAA